MQLTDMLTDIVLLVLGGVGATVWFFWRRRAEQAPVFENIEKAEKLLSLRKELDNTNYTVADLKNLEDTLMGRAKVAKKLSITYEKEAQRVREVEQNTGLTQAEMNIAAADAYRMAESKLDSVIAQIKGFFSPEGCAQFDQSNDDWRAYQQSHAAFVASCYDGGTIQPLIHASVLEAVTIARLVELEAELKFIKETQVPYAEQGARQTCGSGGLVHKAAQASDS
ncbi:lysozyme inhibitor LprI family protein [Thiocapsa rosea]|uniref:Uncharacterized protein DUF1311 n=1 Tax=Thiocapsa rosea TaxID=69360 RepID=A0A495ULR3_9GAMM|nr:lysozyme inhibitor LprI family protein [Thiocapsa rosea]RKT38019.1 uncharacterized protein DUF1311 [Thiocapsa rosea]